MFYVYVLLHDSVAEVSVFWQQAGHVGIYIVLIDTTNQVRQLYIFQC